VLGLYINVHSSGDTKILIEEGARCTTVDWIVILFFWGGGSHYPFSVRKKMGLFIFNLIFYHVGLLI